LERAGKIGEKQKGKEKMIKKGRRESKRKGDGIYKFFRAKKDKNRLSPNRSAIPQAKVQLTSNENKD